MNMRYIAQTRLGYYADAQLKLTNTVANFEVYAPNGHHLTTITMDLEPLPGRYSGKICNTPHEWLIVRSHDAVHCRAARSHAEAARRAAEARAEALQAECGTGHKTVWVYDRRAADGMGDLVCRTCGSELGPMAGD